VAPGLISAPSVSPFVQKGVHSGPALTATQTDLVTQWLKLEIGDRKPRRMLDKGNEAQQPQSNSHPRYALTTELAASLQQFVLETISNMAANRCQNVAIPDAGPDAKL